MKNSSQMKRHLRLTGALCAFLILTLSMLPGAPALADSYKDSEARSMLKMINAFRTGSDAWYWDTDDATKIEVSGLRKLSYDYALEEVAKVRAKEISQSFSHTRPDGSQWHTAFPEGNYYMGENLACGYLTAAEAFEGLQETDEPYAWQGHRRNMLSKNFSRVGFAAFESGGVIYWVQEFASGAVVKSSAGTTDDKEEKKEDASSNSKSSSSEKTVKEGWEKTKGKTYYRNADGSLATGWLELNGKTYYLNKKGVLQTGLVKVGSKKYYFDDSGVMQTGWVKIGSDKYYFDKNGKMKTGWLKLSGKKYYLNSDGVMVTGTVKIDGQEEVFSKKGVWKYSVIPDSDTPLGTSEILQYIRKVVLFVRDIMDSLLEVI